MGINETGASLKDNFASLLSDRPMWVYWITYTVLTGIVFGIFYAAMYFLALQWWVTALVIIAIGMIWGTVSYTKSKQNNEDKKENNKEE